MFMYRRTFTKHLSQRGKDVTHMQNYNSHDAVTAVLHRGNNSLP